MSRRSIHSLNSKVKADECAACAYCDLPFIYMHHEHDHAPRPKAVGGQTVLPACITCHDLKDRVIFAHWPATETASALLELDEAGLLRSIGLQSELPDCWGGLSRWARLAWAKIVRTSWLSVKVRRAQAAGRIG